MGRNEPVSSLEGLILLRLRCRRTPRKNEVSSFFVSLVRQTAHEFVLVNCGGLRPGPLRSVTDRAPEFDDRSSLLQDTSPLGISPCGLFLFRAAYLRRACQKNYPINAGKIGTNNTLGCCFNLSRHKAIERLVVDLKLSRLGSYNRWGFPFVCHFQDSMHLL